MRFARCGQEAVGDITEHPRVKGDSKSLMDVGLSAGSVKGNCNEDSEKLVRVNEKNLFLSSVFYGVCMQMGLILWNYLRGESCVILKKISIFLGLIDSSAHKASDRNSNSEGP